jgi:hypothetical protein
VLFASFAGLVPALDEVVVNVAGHRAVQLQVHVVNVFVVAVDVSGARASRVGVEVDPSHEGDLSGEGGIDEPALLVLAPTIGKPIPAGREARSSLGQPVSFLRRSLEVVRVRLDLRDARLTPEEGAHVDAAAGGAIGTSRSMNATVTQALA